MRTHAAGTFAMNCGFHGIPCVGYYGLDTQQIIHPKTTVEVGDLDGAKEIILKLNNDENFYQKCRKNVVSNYENHYTEEKWKINWESRNENIR